MEKSFLVRIAVKIIAFSGNKGKMRDKELLPVKGMIFDGGLLFLGLLHDRIMVLMRRALT